MNCTRVVEIFRSGTAGSDVLVKGWVRTRRDSKELSFLEVYDGSCFSSIQVIADRSIAGFEENVLSASTGASVEVIGRLDNSPDPKRHLEIKAAEVKLIGPADPETYLLQKKRHSNEFLRTIAHLRPRTNTFGAVFRLRNAATAAIHQFFQERGFIYVQTPIITASDCEGAGTLFTVTTLDPLNPPAKPEDGSSPYTQDFFGSRAFLTVSGQLEAEVFACALGNVYTFGPTFRAENSNTPRHLAEFWMVEPEMAFCDLKGDMELAECFIKHVVRSVLDTCADDM